MDTNKKIYIRYGEYENEYEIGWINKKDELLIKSAIHSGYREIDYSTAISICNEQREMELHRSMFSGFGSSKILPLMISNLSPIDIGDLSTNDGYIYE